MGSKQQVTTSKAEPWAAAQPAMKLGLGDAQNLYKSGIGSQPYTGSTVIPFSQPTTTAMGNIQQNATANSGGQGLSGQYQNVINAGGFNAPQQTAISNLTQTATNPFDITSDPAYMQVRNRVADDTRQNVNLGASSAGRYGSGAHTGVLTDRLAQNLGAMDVDQLTRMQGRQDAATRGLFDAGQAGLGNIGAAYAGINKPSQDMMGVGSMYEDLATRTKNDELRIFDAQQNAPWDQLARLNAISSGAGSLGGTQTQSQPGQSPFASILGGGLGLLSLFGL